MPGVPALGEREIHVWSLDLPGDDEAALEPLSDDERQRAARFYFARDRASFAACRSALRRLIGSYQSMRADDVRFCYEANGKPAIAAGGGPPLHFNLSHSDALALIAFSRASPIGVDVEHIRAVTELNVLAKRVMSADEFAQWRNLPADTAHRAFFATWTRKEAVLKAHGGGLTIPTRSVEVTIDPRQMPRLERFSPPVSEPWRLWPLEAGPDHVACLATPDRIDGLTVRQLGALSVP